MALAVVVDGAAVEVEEPRVVRMIQALVARAPRIREIRYGCVEIHFGEPSQKLHVKLAESDRE